MKSSEIPLRMTCDIYFRLCKWRQLSCVLCETSRTSWLEDWLWICKFPNARVSFKSRICKSAHMFPDALSISGERLCVCTDVRGERRTVEGREVQWKSHTLLSHLVVFKGWEVFLFWFYTDVSRSIPCIFSREKQAETQTAHRAPLERRPQETHIFFFRWTPQTFCFLCSFSCSCYSALSFLLDVWWMNSSLLKHLIHVARSLI